MNNKSIIAIGIVVLLIVIGGIALYTKNENKNESQTSSTNTNTTTPANNTNATSVNNNANTNVSTNTSQALNNCTRNFDQAKLTNDKVDINNRQVTMDVDGYGAITVELYPKDAPKAVENFVRLVNSGFYDCLTFHRIAKGFVVQGGDPDGNGTGGLSAFGKEFEDELNANTPSYKAGYKKGVLAMANRGPNTNSSQFFIMLADAALDHNYTIFGKVIVGQEIVDKIGTVDINPGPFGPTDGSPKTPIVIKKATLK